MVASGKNFQNFPLNSTLYVRSGGDKNELRLQSNPTKSKFSKQPNADTLDGTGGTVTVDSTTFIPSTTR